jgi:type 1 glutamine amidotransferase
MSRLLVAACAAGLAATTLGQVQQPPPAPAAVTPPAPGRGGGQDACGGRSAQPQVPCPNDVSRMMAVLPETAPATPQRPRKVLVLGATRGFVHSSIPLAARTIEEMGKKTSAWATDISYDASVINAENLKQYDAIFLASTTGTFLDDPNDQSVTDARRKAFLDFIRGGKGVAGIHAASDSYHGNPPGTPRGGGRRGGGRGAQAPPPPCTGGGTPGAGGGEPLWPDFNRMIGGYFKYHWNYPTPITVKIDDPKSPINAAFKGRSFNTIDEVYTFNQASFSRKNVHVLTSIDYSLMTDCDKGIEGSKRTDGDYALSWIRREGNGRLFYQALGHHESIYYNNPAMLEHILAGMQYVLGDLKADDSPSVR